MKPTPRNDQPLARRADALRTTRNLAMPQVEFHYRSSQLGNLNPCGGNRTRSFRDLSNGYFDDEAPRAFATDAALFGLILASVAVPLFNSASAMLQLLRALGGV